MKDEVIEAVSRCRMDIQELKGMMKMHFKDEVHHACPCKELKKTQNVCFTVAWWALVVSVSIATTVISNIIRFGW